MPDAPQLRLFQRKPLDQITRVPDDIISVYVVEQHIWSNKGGEAERQQARKKRTAESQTVEEFLIDPVRSFLVDFFRQLSAPYQPGRKDSPVGQGYWIQAEFGSGKSHLLSFIGALALGGAKEWGIIKEKEEKAGKGKRESLFSFFENGLAKKTQESKGVFVAVKTLVGQGGGNAGLAGAEKTLADYVLDAVGEQFYLENDRSLPLYPTEILAERFLQNDLERYSRDLAKFLKDPAYFDDEKQESLEEFLNDLQNNPDPGVQRDCGQRLWDFYKQYLHVTPDIPLDPEPKLKHMVGRLLDAGYAGLLLILDEVSLFMKGRSDMQRAEDERALVILSNRLAKVESLPVWTVCAAQQAIETKLVGVKNIIADERLKLVPLLNKEGDYYNIALARVREIVDSSAVNTYYEDYKRSFSWPQAVGKDEFIRFFPFYKPAIDVVRAVSYNLTTVRSALYFMLQTLKTQRKQQSRELITLWQLFDDVVSYEEDPSGTSRSIASIKTKFPDEWLAYDEARRQIDDAISGPLKAYRSRCEKIVKTLFLYHIANLSPDGLGFEELMNGVMEWKDHEKGQATDLQDNRDHYELLAEKLDLELIQVEKVGTKYRFNIQGRGIDPQLIFQQARALVQQDELLRQAAWHQLLRMDGWPIETGVMTLDLAPGVKSIFNSIAPESQQDVTLKWHNREISGRVYMRNLLDTARRGGLLPSINSAETGLDFSVFISNTPAGSDLQKLVKDKGDPRVLYWSPDALSPGEASLLIDFAAYGEMVKEAKGKETEKARVLLEWVQGRLGAQMGTIYRIVPDSYGRGRITASDHAAMNFQVQGELSAILTPLVGQVLDSTYTCKDMTFDAPAPFNDVNAANVINGIVKLGEFPRGIKPSKEVSASQNYGFALGILWKGNDHKLDLRACRYTRELMDWLEEKIASSGTSMGAATIYKNFMGTGGPNGIHYGLSKRMVQLYLLCLAREGRIRITLAGRNLPVEAIDYTTIAAIDFKSAVFDAFDQVQRLKPPEGWEVLAPFAAVLLNDEAVKVVREDAEIQAAVHRLLDFKQQALKPFRASRKELEDLFFEMGQPLPISDRLTGWESFLACTVDPLDAIPFLRSGLAKAFEYPVYPEETVLPEEVDDLATRRIEVEAAGRFLAHKEEMRAAVRYLTVEFPETAELVGLKGAFDACRARLPEISAWLASESRLSNEFLAPMAEAIASYQVRYLQAFDQVASHTEQVRQQLGELEQTPAFKALVALAEVSALGADPSPVLRQQILQARLSAELFPTALTRGSIERDLRYWPQPAGCPLTIENGTEWLAQADRLLAAQALAVQEALLGKARLLASPALRERLEQGRGEAFVAEILDVPNPDELAVVLCLKLNAPDANGKANLLTHYLKRITVKRISLADFHPSKRTLEPGDLQQVLMEFEEFLRRQFQLSEEDELPILEID
ncbi:MAG: hypothetical protein PHQ40_03520 [Anaerolineaceae bacterium]|nr:hypothetical protein [Anaerolineaceae bacterium]